MKNQVFLSYHTADVEHAKKLYRGLHARQVDVWFDKEHLKPGKWLPQITREISRSRYFLICLSDIALTKIDESPGFQNEELQTAFDIARLQNPNEFTIIPIRLDDCSRGDHRLSIFQQFDLFESFEKKLDELACFLGGDNEKNSQNMKLKKIIEEKYATTYTMYQLGYYLQAAIDWKKLLKYKISDSNSPAAITLNKIYSSIAELLMIRGFYSEAIPFLERIKDSEDIDMSKELHKRGISLNGTGKFEDAEKYLIDAALSDPKNENIYIDLGRSLHMQGKLSEALAMYNKVTDSCEYYWLSLYNISLIYQYNNNIKEAITYINKSISSNGDFAPSHHTKGNYHEEAGDYEEAEKCYIYSYSINNKYYPALLQLSFLYKYQGEWDKLEKIIKRIFDSLFEYKKRNTLDPDVFVIQFPTEAEPEERAWVKIISDHLHIIYLFKAETSYHKEDYKDAYFYADKSYKENDNYQEALLLKGNINIKLGDPQTALDEYQKINDKKILNDGELHNNIGTALFMLGDYHAAILELDKSLELYSINSDYSLSCSTPLATKGACLLKLNIIDEAHKNLLKSLDLYFENPDALTTMGTVSNHLGDREKALKYFIKANKLRPNHEETLSGLALTYALLENYEEAIQYSKLSLKINPFHIHSLVINAISLINTGQASLGRQSLLKAYNLDPDNELVKSFFCQDPNTNSKDEDESLT